jgi:hypothetical protein
MRIAAMLIVLLVGACLLTTGCATTDEGDMPWASPQSWEGSPFIPGFSE